MSPTGTLFLLISISLISHASTAGNYFIGVGRADVTGPAAEVNMMGYAQLRQVTGGIHLRQFSRAYIIRDVQTQTSFVFVNVDACMVNDAIKTEVVKRLNATYGSLYTERNVALSGTHTHSTPGGYHQYLLFDITSLGFVKETFDALVAGITKSIQRAHDSIRQGDIYINQGELLDSNINRSPTAYLYNPPEERANYKYDVDKTMTVLRFVDDQGNDMGMLNWFSVHGTAMNNTNRLISSDNKGYAELMVEQSMNPGSLPGQGAFVAAFAQSNEGDVSPNTLGAHCMDTGLPCDAVHSTCNNRTELCIAFGPGKDMFDTARIIATNQFNKAMELYKSATTKLQGPVDFRQQYVNITNVQVTINATLKGRTCKSAMGYSFAAGTTDGPGSFDFVQSTTSGNPFWNVVSGFLKKPSAEQIACHAPKPILLDTGEIVKPYPWQAAIVDTQILRVGQLVIIAVPGEFTTMAGRRLRDAVQKTMGANFIPVIAGLTNSYSDYITTYEEYQEQRYEGGSTVYGPFTHGAYMQLFTSLATAMMQNQTVPPGPYPPYLLDKQISLLPPVIFDNPPFGKQFGDVIQDVKKQYMQGDVVDVVFVAGNPRNSLMTESTFLVVEKLVNTTDWEVQFVDANWETRFYWERTSQLLGESTATIVWDIPANQPAGTYRIRHTGYAKTITGKIQAYKGRSSDFMVSASNYVKHKLYSRCGV